MPAIVVAPTTETEAVNAMLATIGEHPVNAITETGRLDVANAVRFLTESNKAVQSRGWWFNREPAYTLVVDGDTKIPVPADILSWELTRPRGTTYEFVQRGAFLFDRKASTATGFTASVDIDLIRGLNYEDLPEIARRYIFLRAARVFQARSVGAPDLHQYTMAEENEALGQLDAEELRNERFNSNLSPGIRDFAITGRR